MMKNRRPTILYVEDDIDLSFVTKDNLEMKGYQITYCKDGKEAWAEFGKKDFDLCILDVMLPEMDGFTLAKKIRETNEDIPIIFLSAKSLKEDRIEGLLVGGDDYITKPFSIEELILKIEVFLKRNKISSGNKQDQAVLQIGDYIFDTRTMELTHDNSVRRLTSRESELLKYLCFNQNKVVKKEDILIEVWDNDSYFNSRSLDVFISRLRKYLRNDPSIQINNIHGIGFILSVNQL
jgi:DNA-binding response OmpR family regulator